MAELQKEWNEFLALLSRHRVRFVMVGGLAVSAHGRERYTKDLEVLIDTSEANAKRVGRALVEFGFARHGRAWRAFTKPYRILTLGREPIRIDLLTSITGVSFAKVWKGREIVSMAAGEIPVIGLAELCENKRACGRPQDLADLAALDEVERVRKATRAAARNRSKRPRPAAPRSRTRGTVARPKRRPKS